MLLSLGDIIRPRSRFFLLFLLFHDLVDISSFIGIMYFVLSLFRPLLFQLILTDPWYDLVQLLLILEIVAPLGDMPPIFLSLFDGPSLPLFHDLSTIYIFLLNVITLNSRA